MQDEDCNGRNGRRLAEKAVVAGKGFPWQSYAPPAAVQDTA